METNPPTFTPRDTWPPGTVVKDDYVIESRLGKGGFGTVYKAKHRFLQSDHVIKRLHEEYSSDEEYVRKFIAEGQVIRRLKESPFIVAVEHMTLTADQHLILIMEFMPGGDLNKLMEEKRYFTVPEVCGYSIQIAEGLRAAHAIELIHRDVKPHNVLLAENRRKAKLTDFGIAADHQNSKATSVVRGGSLGFAAPEQWTTSGRNLDGRTDIYSLGVTMYLMLTGCMPYAAGDIGAWIEAVRTTQPIHANKLREDVPEDINRLVMQMIEVRREHRPANIETVIDALRPYADASEWSQNSTLRLAPDRTLITPHDPPPTPSSSQSAGLPPPPPPPPPQFQQSQAVAPGYTPTQFQPANYPPPPHQPSTPPQQQYPPQPQFGGGLPQYNQPQQPVSYGPPPPQQWTPPPPPSMPPPQPQPKGGGGAGKWIAIIPVALALVGGGGWYGWKIYHPGPPVLDDADAGSSQKKEPAGGEAKEDWIAKGAQAQAAGDYHKALDAFRKAPSAAAAAPIAALQLTVEAQVQKVVDKFSDTGQFDKAEAAVDEWTHEFPQSEKLKALKVTIHHRLENQ